MASSRLPRRRALCLFCGASEKFPPSFRAAAEALGAGSVRNGWRLVYGGSRSGLMGAAARAAMAAGGEVIGVRPRGLIAAEMPAAEITEQIHVDTFHERKAVMAALADHFVALPGGLGTLDEVSEMMNLAVTGIQAQRTWFLDIDSYWRPLMALFAHFDSYGASRPGFEATYAAVESVDALFAALDPKR
ncbi:MAG: TIGR00730 family Rossman fold protein [Alphaproteobacteria bacterium]|nr:TIGR00730 family Rossman fold protein [Alphaproteobacteria bacterium]